MARFAFAFAVAGIFSVFTPHAYADSVQMATQQVLKTTTTQSLSNCLVGAQNYPASGRLPNTQLTDPCAGKPWLKCLQDSLTR